MRAALAAGLTLCGASLAQTVDVPLTPLYAAVGLGAGGLRPEVVVSATSPTLRAVRNLMPASYVEWRITAPSPGMYRVRVWLAQWQDPDTVLSFETRRYASPENPFATGYASPGTERYGQTLGSWAFHDLGDARDSSGNLIRVPLWSGDNILRLRNVTDRHWPAFTSPPPSGEPHARPWGFYWSNAYIGRVQLTRDSALPPMGTVNGVARADRPAGHAVGGALICANIPGASPPEPSSFWRNGWFAATRDDGSYSLTAPTGETEVKAGLPSSYQVQGSEPVTVMVTSPGTVAADLLLPSRFAEVNGRPAAQIENVYASTFTGAMGLLAVDGLGGYKVGWVEAGDACTMLVDAPVTGRYSVTSAYTNGGQPGVVTFSTDQGSLASFQQPARTWQDLQYAIGTRPVFLKQGRNTVTQTLVTGNSDQNALLLSLMPTGFPDAITALRMAAGLDGANTLDVLNYDLAGGDGRITLPDAVRVAQSAGH